MHYDKEHNVHCLLRGEKEWVFFDTNALAHKLRDSWNEAPRGRLEGVREDALVVDAVDMPGWQQQLEERDRREEAEQLRRRRRRQGLGKEDPDEMELLQADDVAVSSSLEAV